MSILSTLSDFWRDYSPWILASLVPSLIVGLSQSPKTAGIASWLSKALQLLSILTPRDYPGTFKLPLRVAKSEAELSKASKGRFSTMLLVLTVLVAFTGGCAWWNGQERKDIQQDAIDCAMESVKSNAAHLLPLVIGVLRGDGDWKATLANFTKEFGRDAVACALQMAAIQLQSEVPATGTDGSPEVEDTLRAATRARVYPNEQGWKYVQHSE